MPNLWALLSDADKEKLRPRLPKNWRPPKGEDDGVSVDAVTEKPKGRQASMELGV